MNFIKFKNADLRLFIFVALVISFGIFFANEKASAQDNCAETKAMECFPVGASENDTNSYYCVSNVTHCTNLLKGTVVDQSGKKCSDLGTKNICCQVPLCINATGGTASDGSGNTAPKPVPQTGSTAEWDYGGRSGGLQLVSCTKSGDCTIQDMVQQGIYFANFLIGLSGALFLIAFIWGGTMYLLSFGRDAWVTKGRDAMVKSAIGIVLIMLAWTIVTYVASSLGYTKIG